MPVLYDLIDELGVEVADFAEAHAKIAIAAFARFGKGMKRRVRYRCAEWGADPSHWPRLRGD